MLLFHILYYLVLLQKLCFVMAATAKDKIVFLIIIVVSFIVLVWHPSYKENFCLVNIIP